MSKLISPLIAALSAAALIGAHPITAPAQEKAQVTDVFKERLAVDDPRVVSVRRYDVLWRPRGRHEPRPPVRSSTSFG